AFWLRLERALRTNSCRFWNSSELAPSSPVGAAVLMRVASFMVSSREGLSDNLIVSSIVWLDPSPIASGASAPSRKLLWLPSQRAVSKVPGYGWEGPVVTKWTVWMAALGLSALGATAAQAQSMTLT